MNWLRLYWSKNYPLGSQFRDKASLNGSSLVQSSELQKYILFIYFQVIFAGYLTQISYEWWNSKISFLVKCSLPNFTSWMHLYVMRESEVYYVRAFSGRMLISPLLVALNDSIKHIFVCISFRMFVLKYIATTLKLIKTFLNYNASNAFICIN